MIFNYKSLSIVKDIKKSDKVVDFGSKVIVRIEDDDKEYQVSIVGT